ncbi:unnamed protein product [Rangifer tarandus platyrhynchus]|uniref:Uncharacterized protein n=1 Tax=Rangifer tarandus platyrhynchus TaxID=3082113 RepID=A0ABN8ZF39_RANTA|nr:unnamed protein product [Rangifer tarandus platyrhynchus]
MRETPTGRLNHNLRTPTQGAPATGTAPLALPPALPSCPGPPSHPADYLEPISSSRGPCASLSDQPTLRSGFNLQDQGEAAPSPWAWVSFSGQAAMCSKTKSGQVRGQDPTQNESRDHPRHRGQRSGFQVESRDHFHFVIRGQDPEMSKDQPFVGSGQDPRVKVGTISILGDQGQGPRMRAGTTPVRGGQRSRSQGESRDHPLVARGREPSLSLPPYPTSPPSPHAASRGP